MIQGENTKPRQVIIFSTNYMPAVGGAEVAIKEITDRIPGNDAEFNLITARMRKDRHRKEKIGNLTIYRIGFGSVIDKYLLPFSGLGKTRELVNKISPDLFWCVEPSFGAGSAYLYNLLCFFCKRVPVVLTQQSGQSPERIKKGRCGLIQLSWRLALARTDHVTAISSYLAKKTREFGYEGPVSIIPNGVDIEKFSQDFSENSLNGLKKKLGKKGDIRFLITTSRLVEKNGVGDVIWALPDIPENIEFLVLGDGELRDDLESLASKLGVDDRVHFLGLVDHSEIPRFLQISDIFIRPSLAEGMGISFVEAMAAGIPIIGTPVGGITDFLTDKETGMEVPPGDPEAIAQAVSELRENRDLYDKITTKARKLVEEEYSWDQIAEDMKKVLLST